MAIKFPVAVLCLALTGCMMPYGGTLYPPSAHIKARPKSDLQYAMKTCSELARLRRETYAELAAKSQAHDANPTSLSTAEIADLKGTHDMLSSTMAARNCPL